MAPQSWGLVPPRGQKIVKNFFFDFRFFFAGMSSGTSYSTEKHLRWSYFMIFDQKISVFPNMVNFHFFASSCCDNWQKARLFSLSQLNPFLCLVMHYPMLFPSNLG